MTTVLRPTDTRYTPHVTRAHYPQLDGLRCVAVLLVIWSHAGPRPTHAIGTLGLGVYGVWLFFVLSGFLITGILLRAKETGAPRRATLGTFYRRRVFRIFPAYYTLLTVLLVVGVPIERGDLAALVAFLTNWRYIGHPLSDGLAHLWSLAVEEQFYLVWPLLVLTTPARKLPWVFSGAVGVAVLAKLLVPLWTRDPFAIQFPTFANLDTLGLGALLAWHHHTHPTRVAARRRLLTLGAVVALVYLELTVALAVHGQRLRLVGYEEALAAGLCSAWLIDRCVGGMGGLTGRVLQWRPVTYVGRISYGVYLVQSPIYWLLAIYHDEAGVYARSVPLFVVVTALSLAVASASWRYLEGPLNRLKSRVPYPA